MTFLTKFELIFRVLSASFDFIYQVGKLQSFTAWAETKIFLNHWYLFSEQHAGQLVERVIGVRTCVVNDWRFRRAEQLDIKVLFFKIVILYWYLFP